MLVAFLLAAPASSDDPFLRHTVTVRAVKSVGPAVVNITTERLVRGSPFGHFGGDPFFDRFFRDFFEPRLPQKVQSLGSGVVINEIGHILTNEHVVARASRIRVALADGREFEAELIGADANNDIAVLRARTEEKLPWVEMGTSGDLMVGESVIAIGNPFGLSNTVTTGVISALDRSIRTEQSTYHGFLQTDASINRHRRPDRQRAHRRGRGLARLARHRLPGPDSRTRGGPGATPGPPGRTGQPGARQEPRRAGGDPPRRRRHETRRPADHHGAEL
ncbi:MAG: trypsin-like peptidase domain-containing protein, partial [Myxococcota bacterium]|nr:trypsin-like peptidase domain-containing protein [Myxococcota bacterium]